jgi:hypothetical protein
MKAKKIPNPKNPETGAQIRTVKSMYAGRNSETEERLSLRQFVRLRAKAGDVDAQRWLHNKRASEKKPTLGLGNTRRKGGKK